MMEQIKEVESRKEMTIDDQKAEDFIVDYLISCGNQDAGENISLKEAFMSK